MRTTGIFTTHTFHFDKACENKPFYLLPVGDIHKGVPLHDNQRWKAWIEWAKSKKDAIFLGTGDYFDLASSSEREILSNKKLHEGTVSTFEDIYMSRVLELTKELSFMKGRLIGLVEGNHYGTFQSGVTTTQKMCDILGCKYLGVASLIRLQVKTKRGRASSLDIFVHHGKGSGLLVGSGLNSVQKMADIAIADIYLMGDNHQKALAYSDKMYLTYGGNGSEPKMRMRKILYARTGSFLKGYEDGMPSYVTDKLLTPTNLGTIKIEITPKHVRANSENNFYLDIHASL